MNTLYSFFIALNIKKFLTAFFILFAVIDVLGCTAIIINMRNKIGYIHARKTATVAGVIMVTFLFLGQTILDLFSIDMSSFIIAGSIILFLLGLEMCLNISIFRTDTDANSSSIVPLAFPIIAGTGTLSTLLILRAECETINVLLASLVNLVLIFLVLKYSEWIEAKLGRLGVSIIHKMMGIILIAIAIKRFKMYLFI
ncbi:MAG: MarC family protein [Candidatus Amoebophilus sp.]